jgi:hypothetical protein
MSPTQIKLAAAGALALLAWLLTTRSLQAQPRVTKEVVIGANVLDPDTFGLTEEEIAAQKANPAVDPRMRDLIDVSNTLIAQDDANP